MSCVAKRVFKVLTNAATIEGWSTASSSSREEELGTTPTEVLVEGHEAECHENLFTGGQRIDFIFGVSGSVRHLGFEGEPLVIGHRKFVVIGIGEVEVKEPVVSRCFPHR